MEGENINKPNETSKINPSTAIIIAGVIIALAVLVASGSFKRVSAPAPLPSAGEVDALKNIRPVTAKDHLLGDLKKAEVILVEFSDLQCPFCQRFHPTLTQIVSDYGGRVAWAYRHFPLESIHTYAFKEAEATECAASLGGNEVFWQYVDAIFDPGFNTQNIDSELISAATALGLSESEFKKCLGSGQFKEKIKADAAEAQAAGATGTPFAIIFNKAGKQDKILGAESLTAVKAKIDVLLK